MPGRAHTKAKALQEALAADLSFTSPRSRPHPLHAIHPYAARFPHGLAAHFITKLTAPGETVLDPTCGSGITLLEAGLNGRSAIGADIDPLAIMQSAARSQHVAPEAVWRDGYDAWTKAGRMVDTGQPWQDLAERLDDATRRFITDWFHPVTRNELAALSTAIADTNQASVRNILLVTMSSTIISNRGVSMAADIAHSRPHRRHETTPPPSAMSLFKKRLEATARAYAARPRTGNGNVIRADARNLPIRNEHADLALWSPPYANALDYLRSHKFTLVWLNASIDRLSQLGRNYMGTERTRPQPGTAPISPAARRAVSQLNNVSAKIAAAMGEYFNDLEQAVGETARVLRPGSACIMIVAPSIVRGVSVATHEATAQAIESAGLTNVSITQRPIDRNRRMMPTKQQPGKGIENRMRTEYIVAAIKSQ